MASPAEVLTHICPILPCTRTVPRHWLMCGQHWRMVPPGLKAAVWAAYADGRGVGSRELAAAQSSAITAVREQLAATGGHDD
jgi:hypothetical protein